MNKKSLDQLFDGFTVKERTRVNPRITEPIKALILRIGSPALLVRETHRGLDLTIKTLEYLERAEPSSSIAAWCDDGAARSVLWWLRYRGRQAVVRIRLAGWLYGRL